MKFLIANIYSMHVGCVVTEILETGTIHVGDSLKMAGKLGTVSVRVSGIETFQKSWPSVEAPMDALGIRLENIEAAQIRNRDLLIS